MAEQYVSAILEQVRAIKSDRSSPHFVDATESLISHLETIRFKMDALKHMPLSAQLSRIEIDGYALDEVLCDIEDLFSGSNTQIMQSNTQTDAAETLKVSRNKTKHLGGSMSSDPKLQSVIIALEKRLKDWESNLSPEPDSVLAKVSKLHGIGQVHKSMLHVILGESREGRSDGIKTVEGGSMSSDPKLPNDLFVSLITALEKQLKDLESKLSPEPDSVLAEVSKLHGIGQVKKDILDVILGESREGRSDGIKTISIVGMEGMGKTSLARCICKDELVVARFDNIIFVNVSDDFDLGKIARAIIQALEGLKHEFLCILALAPLQSLLDRIHRKIVNKKSLLVLDGVEGYDCDDWLALKAVFQHGMSESRILITTGEHKFAVAMESSYMFHLKELSDDLCWTIIRGVALGGLNEDSHKYVEDLRLETAKNCHGSPFAAKVLGGVLQHKIKRSEWDSLLRSHIWESPIIPKYIFKILWLSYCDLTWSIRRCLLYCVIFPKNFEISTTLLVQHWMAQGYLDSRDYSEMELKGECYLKCLVAHSFLQDFSRNGGIHTWKMHSIVHDFVRFLFQSELMMEINSVERMGLDLTSAWMSEDKAVKCSILLSDVHIISIRHLTLMIVQGIGFPVDIGSAEKLRTLVAVSQGCFITSGALSNLFKKSKHLRLLDLSLCSGWHNCFGPCGQGNILHKVPEEISELKNLRFLSLAGSKELKILPETLCDLYNLQSLDLTGCTCLTKLPDGMGKLMKLMYLYTWYCSSITFYPKGIGCLILLRELTNVIVRVDHNDANEFSLGDFEALNHLRGDVRVKLVGNMIDADETIRANLWNKKSLNNIRINLDGDIKEDDVIKALKSPSELGIEFIGWWF